MSHLKLRRHALALLLVTMAAPSPTFARDWADAGGWNIYQSQTHCTMRAVFAGSSDTTVHLSLTADGNLVLTVLNPNWSVRADEDYPVTYYLDGKEYGGGKSTGVHAASGALRGIAAAFPDSFLAQFAAAKALTLKKEDILVTRLFLEGSAPATAQLRRCVEAIAAAPPAAPQAVREPTPIADPFAAPRTARSN